MNIIGQPMFATINHSCRNSRLQQLQQDFVTGLQTTIPTAVVNGGKHRLPNNVHLTMPGIDNERAMMEIDEKGIICAVGSACSASNEDPSHVLKAIGLSDADARSSLRFTMGRQTTQKDITAATRALQKIQG